MNVRRIAATAVAKVEIEGLEVAGPVCGRAHTFTHAGRKVEVRLPAVDFGGTAEPKNGRNVEFASGRSVDPTPETSTYRVNEIEVAIYLAEPLHIPLEMLRISPKRPEIAGPELTARLDKLALEYEQRLFNALVHWENVVRWVTRNSMLGLSGIGISREASSRLRLTALTQASDGHRFWLPSMGVNVFRQQAIDTDGWNAIARTLEAGEAAPIWYRYFDTAQRHVRNWNYEDAVLASAIAAETLAREVFWLSSGATSVGAARDVIDGINVRAIVSRWEALTNIPKKAVNLSEIHRLFDARNAIMHVGGGGKETVQAEAQRYLKAVEEFIRLGDEWVYEKRGIPNPRLYRTHGAWDGSSRFQRLKSRLRSAWVHLTGRSK